jgi:hypothetical protein
METLASEFLFEMAIEVGEPALIGPNAYGERRVVPIRGGRFAGPRLSGRILPIGEDALVVGAGGRTLLDVRIVLETADGAAIYVRYQGIRTGPEAVMRRLAAGDAVSAAEYYFRTALTFETGDRRYAWLNDLLAVGVGQRPPSGPVYRVFAIS